MTRPDGGYHVPVLAREAADLLVTDPDGLYVDGTLGGGGHAREILARLGPGGRLLGLDRDPDALAHAAAWAGDPRVLLRRANFAELPEVLEAEGLGPVTGVLLDLGVSSHQVDEGERGFSFLRDGPLDMRMDPEGPVTAADLVNTLDEAELARIFRGVRGGTPGLAGGPGRGGCPAEGPASDDGRPGPDDRGGPGAAGAETPGHPDFPGAPDRREPGVGGPGPVPRGSARGARPRGPGCRDLVPLAGGPPGEAGAPGGGAPLPVPPRGPAVHLRPARLAPGPHPEGGSALRRGGGPEPPGPKRAPPGRRTACTRTRSGRTMMTTTALTRTLRAEAWIGSLSGFVPWLWKAGAFGLCLLAALLLVTLRIQATRLQYEMDELVRQKQGLSERLSNLEVERSALAATPRIEREARRLGFVVPGRDAVVVLPE